MKTIYIIPKVAFGFKGQRVGLDRDITFRRKSVRLKKKLLKVLNERNIDNIDIEASFGFESIESLHDDQNTLLILISPYIEALVKDINFKDKRYYLLSYNEFDSQDVDKIIKRIQELI